MTSTTWSWDEALTGVVPPLISPLTDGGDVDGPATGAVVEHVLGGGCTGLFVLGGAVSGRGSPPRSAMASCAPR